MNQMIEKLPKKKLVIGAREATSYSEKDRQKIILAAYKQVTDVPRKPVYYCTYLVLYRGVHKHEVYIPGTHGPVTGVRIKTDEPHKVPERDINFWIAVSSPELLSRGEQLLWLEFGEYAIRLWGKPVLCGIIKSKTAYKHRVVRQLFTIAKRAGLANSVSINFNK